MGKGKQTFVDPKTGEEIESTWLARIVGKNFTKFLIGVIMGIYLSIVLLFLSMLVTWILGSIVGVIILEIEITPLFQEELFGKKWSRNIHDAIARWQHLRRQRILQRKLLEEEWAGVPDGAISRVRPPGEPEPTSASLSVAEPPEEDQLRLTESVGEPTTEEAVVKAHI